MIAMLSAVMIASLLGSAHCAGMCGPLAAIASSGPLTRTGWTRVMALYHGGRWVGYASLGALAASVGAALDLGGTLIGWQRIAALVAGGMMILLGIAALVQAFRGSLPHFPAPAILQNVLKSGHQQAQRLSPAPRAILIGLLTVLLPCGWLYAFLITATGTAHPFAGALVMSAFWIGTVPALMGVTLGIRKLAGPWRKYLPVATAALLIATGAYTVSIRAAVDYGSMGSSGAVVASLDEQIQRIEQLPSEPMPCCQQKSDD